MPEDVLDRARRLAALLGLDPRSLTALGGATGEVFGAGDVVLRLGARERLDVEAAATRAAAAVVPVAEVLDRVDTEDGSAVLLRRVRGRVALDLDDPDTDRARRRGAACGAAQRALAGVRAPGGVPAAPAHGLPARPVPRGAAPALLHLDLHPFNILLDDRDEVTAVLDWPNAAAGPADLCRARTWAVLHLDPAAAPVRDHPVWRALVTGWSAGARLDDLDDDARAWGCRFLLEDLRTRRTSDELAPARAALARLEAGTGPAR
ncbi:aminoglycoside phosphotransferase family protein [Cellulomonas sp. ACRRI]|uniref:phosphotransferase n=1 Tax=Cellulomonas sp. ACRRI TaxID=2918188 RepID=UPI001EF2030B|nr:phosphotransferase [Cellulomonas sp. ACRRI]MCG7286484.1 aminoglycoside phosphotransferase family protein [Cellulomonas sp. ACRRI]